MVISRPRRSVGSSGDTRWAWCRGCRGIGHGSWCCCPGRSGRRSARRSGWWLPAVHGRGRCGRSVPTGAGWPVSWRHMRTSVRVEMRARRARMSRVSGSSRCCRAQSRVAERVCAVGSGSDRGMHWARPPSRCDDQLAGDLVGDCRTHVLVYEVQAQVDAGRHPGRGRYLAVVDVEDVAVHTHVRVEILQVTGAGPVGCHGPAVEKSSGGESERARADPGDPCPRR